MTAVSPYLNFNGNTEEAFNFYKSVFGGEFLSVMRFKDNPECGEMTDADKERIMHISLPIGDGAVLIGPPHLTEATRASTGSPAAGEVEESPLNPRRKQHGADLAARPVVVSEMLR